jgi:outer membrane protein TolC
MKRRVFERLLTVAKERDQQFAVRTKAGELSEFDRNDNLRQVFQRESQLLQAERGLQRAAFELSLFLRAEDGSARPVAGFAAPTTIPDTAPADVADALSKAEHALQARPDVRRLERIKEQQELDLVLARNDFLPRLDLGSYLARDLGEGSSNRDETELQLGLRVEVPLQTRSQQGRLDFLNAKQREIDFQETALRDRIRTEVLDSINALDIARSRVDVARKELELAKNLEAGELFKFNQGDSNLIFINLREQTTADSAVREIDTLLDFQRAIAAYHAAVGIADLGDTRQIR